MLFRKKKNKENPETYADLRWADKYDLIRQNCFNMHIQARGISVAVMEILNNSCDSYSVGEDCLTVAFNSYKCCIEPIKSLMDNKEREVFVTISLHTADKLYEFDGFEYKVKPSSLTFSGSFGSGDPVRFVCKFEYIDN